MSLRMAGSGLRQEPHPFLYLGGLPGPGYKDRATASATHSAGVCSLTGDYIAMLKQ